MTMSSLTQTAPRPARDVDLSSAVAAYSGRHLLGWIAERSDRCEAICPDGKSLGLFNSARAAWAALSEQQGVK